MANVARVRVELKDKYNNPDKNYRELWKEFTRRVNSGRIMHDYKDHQHYESRSKKLRQRYRESVKHHQMEIIEQKIVAGERVNVSDGLVKKVMANLHKEKKERKEKRKNRSLDRFEQ